MAVNHYFQSGRTSGTTNEQNLLERLTIESIQIYGHDVYYLPRTLVKLDRLFNEDILSQYTQAFPIEMYLLDTEEWDGQGEMFSHFGYQVRDKATFVVAKSRWETEMRDHEAVLQLPDRPCEGDLLYFPKTDAIFEITFVDHLNPMYQLNKFYVYTLKTELFEYSSEAFETGFEAIDGDMETLSSNKFQHGVTLNTGGLLLMNTGMPILEAEYDLRNNNPQSNNDLLQELGIDLLDFNTINPFGDI